MAYTTLPYQILWEQVTVSNAKVSRHFKLFLYLCGWYIFTQKQMQEQIPANMSELNLPHYQAKTKINDGKPLIFDDWRNRFVALTPEEWVRQHFMHFLVIHLHYPHGRMATEHTVLLNGMKKRADAVIFNQQGIPVAIIECKAPHIPLDQKVFDQVAVYCRQMGVATFFLTNGMEHYACRIDTTAQRYKFLSELPDYVEL